MERETCRSRARGSVSVYLIASLCLFLAPCVVGVARAECDLIPGTNLEGVLPDLEDLADGTIDPFEAFIALVETLEDCNPLVEDIDANDLVKILEWVYAVEQQDLCPPGVDCDEERCCRCLTDPAKKLIADAAPSLVDQSEASDALKIFLGKEDNCDPNDGNGDPENPSECGSAFYGSAFQSALPVGTSLCDQITDLLDETFGHLNCCWSESDCVNSTCGGFQCSSCVCGLGLATGNLPEPIFADFLAGVLEAFATDSRVGADLCAVIKCARPKLQDLRFSLLTYPNLGDATGFNPLLVAEQLGALACLAGDRSEQDDDCGDGKDRNPDDSDCGGGGSGAAAEGAGGRGHNGPGSAPCGSDRATGDPVSLTTLDKVETASDLSLAVRGGAYSFTRSYSSAPDGAPESMGYYADSGIDKPVKDWLGNGWDFSNIRYIETFAENWKPNTIPQIVKIVDAGQSSKFYYYDASSSGVSGAIIYSRFRPEGSSNQYFEIQFELHPYQPISGEVYYKTTLRLVQPGAWEQEFDARPAGETAVSRELGRRYMTLDRDAYGNERRYRWEYINGGSGSRGTQRLVGVYLNGDDESSADAWVRYHWSAAGTYTVGEGEDFGGKLLAAQAFRSGESVPIARVSYSYLANVDQDVLVVLHGDYPSAATDSVTTVTEQTLPSGDLGTPGDLVQVVNEELLNRPYGGTGGGNYRVRVTQYRYHNGSTAGLDLDGDQTTDLSVIGFAGQLKMVLAPQQIEYAAQIINSDGGSGSGADTVLDIAKTWLDNGDSTVVWDEHTLAAVAAKIIGYDIDTFALVIPPHDPADPDPPAPECRYYGRVSLQYVSSGCGCGSSTPGARIRHTYDRFTWIDTGTHTTNTGLHGVTFRHTESEYDSGSWVVRRVTAVDKLRLQYNENLMGGASMSTAQGFNAEAGRAVVVNHAVSENGTGDWRVTHSRYDYGATGYYDSGTSSFDAAPDLARMLAKAEPCPTAIYTPASTNTPPTYQAGTDGRVELYLYDTQGRHIQTIIHNTLPSTLPTNPVPGEVMYSIVWGDGTGSEPSDAVVVGETIEGGAASPDLAPVYGIHYHDVVEGAGGDPDMVFQSIAWKKTTLPATTNAPVAVSYEFYDTSGNNIWSRHADGSMIYRAFSPTTGRVTKATHLAGVPTNAGSHWIAFNASVFPDLNISSSGENWTNTMAISSGDYQVRQMEYDPLGRLVKATSHTGVETFTIRTMMDNSLREDMPYYCEVMLPPVLVNRQGDSVEQAGPATVIWMDAEGQAIRVSEFTLDLENTDYSVGWAGSGLYQLVTEIARSATDHTVYGVAEAIREWPHVTDSSLSGVVTSTEYTTSYDYDLFGRVTRTTRPNGTFTETIYDFLGRVVSTGVGVGSGMATTVTEYFYDGQTPGSPAVYGEGLLTKVRQLTPGTSSGNRETNYYYDFRGRQIAAKNPLPPHSMTLYDNQGRAVETAIYDNSPTFPDQIGGTLSAFPTSGRRQHTKTKYNSNGQVFEVLSSLEPSKEIEAQSNPAAVLKSNSWFDEMGRAIASSGPNGQNTKTQFDWLGRAVNTFVVTDAPTSLGGAASVSSDIVLAQSEFLFDDDHNLEMSVGFTRPHGDSITTGALTYSNAIPSYTLYVYDDADRQVATISYGTNATTDSFDSGATAPSLPAGFGDLGYFTNDEMLDAVTAVLTDTKSPIAQFVRYNARGLVEDVIQPRENTGSSWQDKSYVTHTFYDDLSRRIAVAENATSDIAIRWETSGTPDRWVVDDGSSAMDEDRVTSFVYDEVGNVVYQTAHTGAPSASGLDDGQTTQYVYGVTTSDTPASGLDTNDLLAKIHYPNESTGLPDTSAAYTVSYAYNAQGEMIWMEDQNQTEHVYTRDDLGRITVDDVDDYTTGPTLIDTSVLRLAMEFDDYGLLTTAQSYATSSSQDPLNVVEYVYDDLLRLLASEQDHDGDGTADGVVVYLYGQSDASEDNYMRMTGITYPSDYDDQSGYTSQTPTIEYEYGSSNSIDDKISRISGISEYNGDDIVDYYHAGTGMPVIVDYPMLGFQLARDITFDGNGFPDSPDDDGYPALDRHGRILRQTWLSYTGTAGDDERTIGSGAARFDLEHAYDRLGNRTRSVDKREGAHLDDRDWWYSYDGLMRLETAENGVWDPTPANQVHTPGSQNWALDRLGNWDQFDIDLDDDANFQAGTSGESLDRESRTHDEANQLSQIDNTTWNGTAWSADPSAGFVYAPNGNMTDGRTDAFGQGDRFTYDAWNRLVKVQRYASGHKTVGVYAYDALNRRIRREIDTAEFTPDGLRDEVRSVFWSDSWQMLEERVIEDDNTTAVGGTLPSGGPDRIGKQIWGTRYIDDAVAKRVNRDPGGSGTWDVYYYVTDAQFSVRGVFNAAGGLVDLIDYTPYGVARHRNPADNKGSAGEDLADQVRDQANDQAWFVAAFQGAYSSDADLAAPFGVLDLADVNHFAAIWDPAGDHEIGPETWLATPNDTDAGSDNSIGYCGYMFDVETEMYAQRNRFYDPGLGRWTRRDPAGYVDGMSLLAYAESAPQHHSDPMGLQAGNSLKCQQLCKRSCYTRYLSLICHQALLIFRWTEHVSAGATFSVRLTCLRHGRWAALPGLLLHLQAAPRGSPCLRESLGRTWRAARKSQLFSW